MARHVLIVDDDPIIRNLMSALLRRKRIASSQAVNGEEAIALFRDSLSRSGDIGFDLIILDLMMPKASGSDVLDFVEAERPEMLQHFIVVSAAGDDALEPLAGRGCGCILQKPFEPEKFYESVMSCMRDARDGVSGNTARLAATVDSRRA